MHVCEMSKLLYLAKNFVPHKSFEKYENNHQYRKQRESLYIQQNRDSNIYFTTTTLTIRTKETKCMKITTHDYYKYIVLLTIVAIVVRATTNIIYITNKMMYSIVV